MTNTRKIAIIFFMLILLANAAIGQPANPPVGEAPINGALVYLILGAILLGIKKFRGKK